MVLVAGLLSGSFALNQRSALADAGIHVQPANNCTSCHRVHSSSSGAAKLSAQTGSYAAAMDPDLCLTCHGSSGTGSDLNVEDGRMRSNGLPLRAGGFSYAAINTTDGRPDTIGYLTTAQPTTSWHTIDGTTMGTMWGNGALNSGPGPSFALRCTSCHDPHGGSGGGGTATYRLLRPVPEGSGASPVYVTDQTGPKTYYTRDYFYGATAASGVQLSNWCATCHTRYKSSSTANSGDDIFTNRHKSDGSSGRTCVRCHAAHGTNAAMPGLYSSSVAYPGGGSGSTDNNNSRLLKMDNRGICIKCHWGY